MKIVVLLFMSILLTISIASPLLQPRTFEEETPYNVATGDVNYRLLPQNIKISRYDIKLTPYFSGFNAFTFDGDVTITAVASEDGVKQLKLHAKSLNIQSVTHGTDTLNINPIDEKYDFWMIDFETEPVKGEEFKINIKYTGILGDDMHGFYRSYYEETQSDEQKIVTKWMGTTQFQPVHARRAFPCFDEPGYKAIFKITIRRPITFEPSLSNTLLENSTELAEYVEEVFYDTPIMPAYLIAFIVSEYKSAAIVGENTTDQSGIWARPGANDQGEYALITSRKLVKTLGDYVDYNYTDMNDYLKNDHVAIPDFSAGAMENWGLATYREAYLMYHPEETSVRYQQLIASILSHEIAHFWFGDLVTCKWWSQTWLNEGFARYFQHFLTDWMEDEDKVMDMTEQFTVAQVHTAMVVDASNTSTPMTNENTFSPAEVQSQFGTVTYNKGASVIRMVRNWLGEDAFQKALQSYMKANEYNVVEEEQLFAELQKAAVDGSVELNGTTVESLMKSWTNFNGFPVLEVTVQRDASDATVTISQNRFMKADQIYTDGTDRLWEIPITYTTKTESVFNESKTRFVLKEKNTTIEEKINKEDWIIFNTKQTGFYRVKYDNVTLKLIVDDLNSPNNKIDTLNKAQLVDDLFNFAREGMMDYTHMLDSTLFLQNIDEYSPWSAAFAGFSFLRLRFSNFQKIYTLMNLHVLTMMKKTLLEKLGFEEKPEDNHLIKLFRMNSYNLACQLDYEDCKTKSIDMFQKFRIYNTSIKANHREYVYCTALRYGDGNDFDFLWNKYIVGNVVSEKVVILNALGCSLVNSQLERYLASTLYQDSPIRAQDRMVAFNSVLTGNPENIGVVFNFVKNNVKNIKSTFGSGSLRTMIDSIAIRMSSNQLGELGDFLDNDIYLEEADRSAGKRSIQIAEEAMDWAKEKGDDIDAYLSELYSSAGSLKVSLTLSIIMLIAIFMNN